MLYKVLDMEDVKITIGMYWKSSLINQQKMIEIVMKWSAYYIDDRLTIVEYVKTLKK